MFDVTDGGTNAEVAGFRLDAVDTLFEDPALRDNPVLPGLNKYGDPREEDLYNTKLSGVHDVLRDLRRVADENNAVLIGETWTKDVDELKQYYGEHSNELQMPMDLMFATVNKLSPPEFPQADCCRQLGWRLAGICSQQSRYRAVLRALWRWPAQPGHCETDGVALLDSAWHAHHVLRRRDRNGKTTTRFRKEDVKDPIGRTGWPQEKGRDGERTPMQWNDSANAGFTRGTPWLPVPPSYRPSTWLANLKIPLRFFRSTAACSR